MAQETAISRTYGFLNTLTGPAVVKEIFDVITPNIPTIHHFLDEDSEECDGGDAIRFNLFKEIIPGTGAGRTQPVTADYITPWTVAEYQFKFLYVPALLPKQDLILNEAAGGNRLESLVAGTTTAMIRSMFDLLGGSVRGLWTAGVSDEGDKTRLTGIPSLVKSSGTATGTTAGVSRANAWWQSVVTAAITSFATNGRARITNGLLSAKRAGDFPNLGITNQAGFENYMAIFTSTTQMNFPVNGNLFDVGVPDVSLYGLRVFPDDNAPANEFRTLNTTYMMLKLLRGNYLAFSPAMETVGKDDVEIRLRFAGNLVSPWLNAHACSLGSDTA